MQRLKLFLPLVAFALLAALFFVMIQRIGSGDYSPQALPSALLNRPFPAFSLAQLEQPEQSVTRSDLVGDIALVNVWATWCPSCHAEHAYLNQLVAEEGVILFGVNYKDEADAARRWLADKGNPYRLNIFDPEGRLGLDMGVTGAPETYLLDHRGFVRLRYQGPMDASVWREKFKPLIDTLNAEQLEAQG